jgi:hypothetical protein
MEEARKTVRRTIPCFVWIVRSKMLDNRKLIIAKPAAFLCPPRSSWETGPLNHEQRNYRDPLANQTLGCFLNLEANPGRTGDSFTVLATIRRSSMIPCSIRISMARLWLSSSTRAMSDIANRWLTNRLQIVVLRFACESS